jgi:hypothetical protein
VLISFGNHDRDRLAQMNAVGGILVTSWRSLG